MLLLRDYKLDDASYFPGLEGLLTANSQVKTTEMERLFVSFVLSRTNVVPLKPE